MKLQLQIVTQTQIHVNDAYTDTNIFQNADMVNIL